MEQGGRPRIERAQSAIVALGLSGFIILLCLLLVFLGFAQAGTISGKAEIVDGDTLVIGATKIRLNAIDAPETDQSCLDAYQKLYPCGLLARDRLRAYIGQSTVSCETEGIDRYGRNLAICFLKDTDLNNWLVREGLALAYIQYSNRYQQGEEEARRNRKGLWSGAFVAPWDWRHRTPQTPLLGAIAAKVSQTSLSNIGVQSPPIPDCAIKGNVNHKGDRIYFLPVTSAYGKVKMDKGLGERWFCSEQEAEAAGWRKAKN